MVDNLNASRDREVVRRQNRLNRAAPGGFQSVSRGTTRFVGENSLLVEGSARVTGTLYIDGILNADGTITLTGDMTVADGGKITVGEVTVDPGAGGTGGLSSLSAIKFDSPQVFTTGDLVVGDDLNVSDQASIGADLNVVGDIFGNSKNFLIPHPVKAGKLLRHGSTESPTHGIEYVGVASLDANGEALVRLPEYFEALALREGRTVHVTAIGRPFVTGSEIPAGGQFRVYGEPGRKVSWLVRASRGTFEVEPDAQAS